jgi:hypothetical protein
MREPIDKPDESPPEKNQAAAELGRRGGLKGGHARAAKMSKEELSDAARLAAQARWARIREAGETLERPNPDRGLFVFTLEPEEAAYITQTAIAGRGGLQTLQKKLQTQLAEGNVVKFDNTGLGQLIRYMTQYRDGGFQGRLRHAFERSLRNLLDL